MATKKTATKTTKKAEINIPKLNLNKKTTKKATKELKKLGAKSIISAIICLVLGIGIGAGAWFFVCRKDKFDLIGQDELSLTLNQTYTDQGVKIIAFGKDVSSQVIIETNLEPQGNNIYGATESGTYYIKYTTQNFKYGKLFKIQKIRLITFEEESEGMDYENQEVTGNE